MARRSGWRRYEDAAVPEDARAAASMRGGVPIASDACGQGNRPGGRRQARRACSSGPSPPCRQFRARATRPRTTSGGSPGVLAMCHSVGSSYSACPGSGDPTLGSPPAGIPGTNPGPSRAGSRPYRGCWEKRAGRSRAFPAFARLPLSPRQRPACPACLARPGARRCNQRAAASPHRSYDRPSRRRRQSRHRLRDHPYPKKIEESSSSAGGYWQRSASLFSAHLIHALYFLSVLP